MTTIHTRQLQQYTQDNYNNTHIMYTNPVKLYYCNDHFNIVIPSQRPSWQICLFPSGKVKGKGHPITGHEGPEVE